MHVVHIYKDYYPVLGGIENHIKALAEGLALRGHRVTVLVTNTSSEDVVQREGNLTIIKAARMLHLASTPLSLNMLRYARHMADADILDLHFPYPPGDLVSLMFPNNPSLVVTYHSDIVRQQTMLKLYGPLLQQTLRRAARIVPTSPQYIQSSPWLRPHADRCTVSALSVDPARFAQRDTRHIRELRMRYGTPLLLFVGKLRYYKGLHFLIEALPMMHRQAQLLLVGNGPEEATLRTLAQKHGVQQRVHFPGEVCDVALPAYYQAADVFVLPSHLRAEAFGIVQLEAQAAGLPIVCTELGTGTSYITQHGKTGFVVPPANPLALARALDVLLANQQLARHMGEAGQQRANTEFSHTRMVQRKEQIYHDVLVSAGTRHRCYNT